jgi:MFS family permease
MIKAGFFIQLVGASFFLILNIYLAKRGYKDYEIANFISYRFLAVMLLAFPLGRYIKGKKLKPFFLSGSIGVPVIAIILLYAVKLDLDQYLPLLFILWGVFFTFFQVSSLPYIMRNTEEHKQSHAISLNYATHSFGMIISGLVIYFSGKFTEDFNEGRVLFWITLVSFLGVYFLTKIKVDLVVRNKDSFHWSSYDWNLLLRAIIPTLVIAIGAGLTIPFINLFFFHNFHIDSADFAVIGGIASIFVAILALLVPDVKKKLGFKRGITFTQIAAVLALVALATTEFYNNYIWALPVAVVCYWIRTPLMNMAAPMTSELTMNYVGEKNQEMLSAVMAAIWSGSWFFSSQIFGYLKSFGLKYAYIFYITAILYSLGILMYYFLILDYELRKK